MRPRLVLLVLVGSMLVPAQAQQGDTTVIAPPPNNHTGKGVLRASLCPPVPYPENSLKLGHSGRGRIRVEVAANGNVLNSYVAVSSNFPELDGEALTVVPKCKYIPSYLNGRPIKDSLIVEFVWSLEPWPTVTFDSK
jgi:TonB family protein